MSIAAALLLLAARSGAASPTLVFVSDGLNDVLAAVPRGATPLATKVAPTLSAALAACEEGDGLLVMADGMLPANPGAPQTNTTAVVTPEEWAEIRAKKLKVYLEFPRYAPPEGGAPPEPPLAVAQTLWERAAVSAAEGLGAELPHLALLHPHKHVDFVKLPPSWLQSAALVIAKVAGYDTASFGLPGPNATWPLLATPRPGLMVAATQLSHCRLRRFAPSARWMAVVSHILDFVSGGAWKPPASQPLWVPSVTASFSRDEKLPPDAERQALVRGVQFYRNARLLPTAARATELAMLRCSTDKNQSTIDKCAAYARLSSPYEAPLSGEGQLGVFEGLTSDISVRDTRFVPLILCPDSSLAMGVAPWCAR